MKSKLLSLILHHSSLGSSRLDRVRRAFDVQQNRLVEDHVLGQLPAVTPDEFDALVLPGGFGAAKNLCTFGVDGPDCKMNEDVAALIRGTLEAKKPLGAMCIAPAAVARPFRAPTSRPR